MKGLAYAGLFFCMNPLCRCATSPPVGRKITSIYGISPPVGGSARRAWGVTTASTHNRGECLKGVGGHYCQYAQPGECPKGVGVTTASTHHRGECPKGKGEYIIRKGVPFRNALLLKSATTYSPTIAVPSALSGLTSLFGMGRGGTPTL